MVLNELTDERSLHKAKDLKNWRENLERSFEDCDRGTTILRDGKLVFDLRDKFDSQSPGMFYCGQLLHTGLLWLEIMSKHRLGVIDKITEHAKLFECNIIGCQGDLARPRVPKELFGDADDEQDEISAWFQSLNRFRLHQSNFQITGSLNDLRDFWNSMSTIKDLPIYRDPAVECELRRLKSSGPDRMGILQDMANILLKYDINIQTLASRVHFSFDPEKTSAVVNLILEVPRNRLHESERLLKELESKLGREWSFSELTPLKIW